MKVLFYYDTDWVLGKIHTELCKVLYPDIDCDLFSWSRGTSKEEMDLLNSKYDFFVSLPQVCFELNFKYCIPGNKLVAIAHSEIDLIQTIESGYNASLFDQIRGYAVISPTLINSSISLGIKKIPNLLKIGLFINNYKKEKSQKISNLGYYQMFCRLENNIDIKRGVLVKAVSKMTGLNFIHRQNLNYLAIDKAYTNIDICMFASLTEGNPYVALESFAAGIPVLGTNTGIFKDISKSGGGIILPFKEDEYIEKAIEKIKILQSNPDLYSEMSDKASEESKKFDWSILKNDWISYFNSI